MDTKRSTRRTARVVLAAVGAAALLAGPITSAGADPVSAGTARAFGATATLTDQDVVPPTAEASMELPPGGEDSASAVEVPGDPVIVTGVLNARAAVHEASDLASTLVTEGTTQAVAGPYNARGEAVVDELDVLLDSVEPGVSLLTADVVRAEAVGVCRGGAVEYSANSEIVNLVIGGQDIPLNAPVTDIIDAISGVLDDTTLSDTVVDVERNVVEVDGDGASVDALVVTLLPAVGETPLAQVRIAHAEVGGLVCGAATEPPECSDTIDNDGDGKIDHPNDPGCDSPEDDSEIDAPAPPECSDTIDNDGDGKIDFSGGDPGCESPADDSEIDGPIATLENTLPRTGSGSTVALVLGAGLVVGALALRRLRAATLT